MAPAIGPSRLRARKLERFPLERQIHVDNGKVSVSAREKRLNRRGNSPPDIVRPLEARYKQNVQFRRNGPRETPFKMEGAHIGKIPAGTTNPRGQRESMCELGGKRLKRRGNRAPDIVRPLATKQNVHFRGNGTRDGSLQIESAQIGEISASTTNPGRQREQSSELRRDSCMWQKLLVQK
jgi:hypothetical protein